MLDGHVRVEVIALQAAMVAVFIPTQGAAHLRVVLLGNGAHHPDGSRHQQRGIRFHRNLDRPGAAIQDHLADDRQVFGIGKDARIAGYARIDASGDGIVDGSHQREPIGLDLRGRAERNQLLMSHRRAQIGPQREIAGMLQSQRLENIFLYVFVQRLRGDLLDNML